MRRFLHKFPLNTADILCTKAKGEYFESWKIKELFKICFKENYFETSLMKVRQLHHT